MTGRVIVAELWIPRSLDAKLSELVVRGRDDEEITVDFEPWRHAGVPGARLSLRFVELDPKRGDQELSWQALDYALLATNRIVRSLAFLTSYPRGVPALQAFELVDLVMYEDLGAAGRRRLPSPDTNPLRPVRFKGATAESAVQALLDRAFSGGSVAEELWREALDAAYEQRPREALVAARAAVEVAWEGVATARVDALCEAESAGVTAVLRAHLDEALLPRTSMHERLDRYSRSILGFSLREEWGDRWSDVGQFFGARNRGAHGAGRVSHAEALQGVRTARELIDRIEQARSVRSSVEEDSLRGPQWQRAELRERQPEIRAR